MAKSKEKKPHPKPPENAPTVIEIKKDLTERTALFAKATAAATKDGKLNRLDPKYRLALKRLKRSQRKLSAEAFRLRPRKPVPAASATPAPPTEAAAAPAAAAAAPAAPAEGEKK
jgi:hypothetical protein